MSSQVQSVKLDGLDRIMAAPATDEDVARCFRPLIVTSFLYFKQPLSIAVVRELIAERFLRLVRFRSLLQEPEEKGGQPSFVEVPKDSINMEALVAERFDVKTEDDLNRFCTKIYETDLGLDLPRWRAYVFNNMADGRSMLCLCIDHVIGDGPSLVAALMKGLDEMPVKATAGSTKRKAVPPSCFATLSALVGGTCAALCGDRMPADQPNKLKLKDHRNPGSAKAIAQTPAIPMDKLKEVAAKFGGATLNDVLMVVVSLALRQYFLKYDPKALNNNKVRANFPINMRPAGADVLDDKWFGNLFSQGQIRFPVHLEDPKAVFADLKRQLDQSKLSPEKSIRQKLTNAVAGSSCIPMMTKKDIVLDSYGQVTAMFSNVPGPNAEMYFGGQPLDDLSFYAFAPIGLYFGTVSYKGTFRAGVCCDAECEANPARLADEWAVAFDRMYESAMRT